MVVGAGMQAYSAGQKQKAANQANKKNVEAQEGINKWRMDQWLQQFGEGGAPVFLPRYARDEEQRMFKEGMDIYNATYQDPEEQKALYERAKQMYMPFMERQLGDIISGQTTEDRLGYLEPVAEARLAGADVSNEAMRQAMAERTAQLQLQQRAAGLGGSGSAAQRSLLQADFAAKQASAAERANAVLANATDANTIREAELERRISTAAQAPGLVESAIRTEQMPAQAMAQNYSSRMNMFQPYHVQRGQTPPELRAPVYTPRVKSSTAIVGSVGSSLSSIGSMGMGGGGGGGGK